MNNQCDFFARAMIPPQLCAAIKHTTIEQACIWARTQVLKYAIPVSIIQGEPGEPATWKPKPFIIHPQQIPHTVLMLGCEDLGNQIHDCPACRGEGKVLERLASHVNRLLNEDGHREFGKLLAASGVCPSL